MKRIFLPVVMIGILLFISNCTKTEVATLPSLTTTTASNITSTSATSGGNISSDGNASVTVRGVCWRTTSNPTVADSKTSNGTGTGQFVSNITGLSANTTFFVRAYSTNSAGTAYGNEVSFTTGSIAAGNEVSIMSSSFSPKILTVSVNTTVKWTNSDGIAHTVTSDNAVWNSGNISAAGTFSFTFTATGTFNYHCTFHPSMTGTVIVQ
jgi:plastocyanin